MIKKAVKRPDEVEYIEFKGRENFKEVAEFYNDKVELVTKVNGEECLSLEYRGDKLKHIPIGTIFYRYEDISTEDMVVELSGKEYFFRRYKEER